MKFTRQALAASMLLALSAIASAQVATPLPAPVPPATTTPAALGVPANRLVNRFTGFAGSRENAIALVTALRNGTGATLVTTTTCVAPCATPLPVIETPIDVTTRPMGWGNVRHALGLAQHSLAQAGITNPTPQQLAAALNGGTVTPTGGTPVELNGILTMRSGGMGWGQIAHAEGTTMGRVNQGLKPFNAVTTPPAPVPRPTPVAAPVPPTNLPIARTTATTGIVTGAGSASSLPAPGRGKVVTAGGGASTLSAPGRGIVTGNGNAAVASSQGVGNGNGHGQGHAMRNAGGNGGGHAAGAGMTTAANTAASTSVTTAHNGGGQGNGRGGGNGNGNGPGNGKNK